VLGPPPGRGVESMSDAGEIGRAGAGPLLAALDDPVAETRLAALDALRRLPLDNESWLSVRDFVLPALESDAAPEHRDVIERAARVPVRSVRERLWQLTESGDADTSRRALFALADAGDARSVEPLLALLGDPAGERDAARLLARLDISRHLDAVRRRCAALASETEPSERRFWLALALARAGEVSQLLRELRDEKVREARSGVDGAAAPGLAYALGIWPDDEDFLAELRRGPRLPESLCAQLGTGRFSGTVARLLVEADESGRAPASPAVSARPGPLMPTAEQRDRVRAALDRNELIGLDVPRSDWQAAVEEAAEEAAAGSDRPTTWALIVSDLFRRAALAPDRQGLHIGLGNAAAILAAELGADYVPDVDGLFDAYLLWAPRGRSDGTGAQTAWAAARGGMACLLTALAPRLARGKERLPAAWFIAEAAGQAAWSQAPLFGGLPRPPEPPVPTALIEDAQDSSAANDARGARRR